jgi:hypothetical protein
MRRIHPFVLGSMLAGLVLGGVAGTAVLNLRAIVAFALLMAAGAGVAALVCRRWPGLAAPAWKLWPVAAIANPLFLAGIAWSIDQWGCLVGRVRGWDCLLAELAPALVLLCLIPPAAGLALRWWRGRVTP